MKSATGAALTAATTEAAGFALGMVGFGAFSSQERTGALTAADAAATVVLWRGAGFTLTLGRRVGRARVIDEVSDLLAPADPAESAKAEGIAAIADPTPSANARRPIRPTYLAEPDVLMWRADGKSQLLKQWRWDALWLGTGDRREGKRQIVRIRSSS